MILCPQCDQPIPPEDINIAQDVALCRGCNTVTAVSAVVRGAGSLAPSAEAAHREHSGEPALPVDPHAYPFDPPAPPPGAWFHDDGVEVHIGATTRSRNAAILVPFAIIWSGGALGGIYGSQIASGKFDLVLSLFGLVFVIAAGAIVSFALRSPCGKVEVRVRQGEGSLFVGVGSMGRSRRFDASRVTAIREDWAGWSSGRRPRRAIIIEGAEKLSFGSMLSEERRLFVMGALRRAMKVG